jgi:hypothetical protein
MEIDKNLIENAVSPLAIVRKNFLFCGSHQQAAQLLPGSTPLSPTVKKRA